MRGAILGRGAAGFGLCLAALAVAPAQAQAQGVVMFSSPTKNIGCALDRTAVRCDIRQRNWRPPPKPPSCQLDWGFGLTLDRRGRGQFVCAGDTVLGSARTLAYGRSIQRGRFRCVSRVRAMRCVNRRNDTASRSPSSSHAASEGLNRT